MAAVVAVQQPNDFEVWPENWPAFTLFSQMSTQWRIGMSGPTGLDYAALYPLIDRLTDSPTEWDALFDEVRVMEIAALEEMNRHE